MIVNKPFWTRIKGSVESYFSYAKATQAAGFAAKYGGAVMNQIDVADELFEFGGEVFSVLRNDSPVAREPTGGEFKVYVKRDAVYILHGSYATISDANTEAKGIIAHETEVVVIKQ